MKMLLALPLLGAALPAFAGTIAIVGGTVAIGDGSAPIEQGTVLFADGRVVAAGAGIPVPAGAAIVDARGKWVTAGLVAGFSTIGLFEVETVRDGNDTAAPKSGFSASLDVAAAVNPRSQIVRLERSGGITKALVSGSASTSIFAGYGAAVDLGEAATPIVKAKAFELVELGQDGAALAGGSRPAAYAMLREAFAEAALYGRDPKSYAIARGKPLFDRSDVAALWDVLEGRTILLAHVERASDIRSALALKAQYPKLRLTLLGATEGWLVADEIAKANVPVIAAGLSNLPEELERIASTESNVGRLEKAGVKVAVSTIDMTEPIQQRRITQLAGNLVAISRMPGMTGLTWGQAFATITSRPAEAVGLEQEIGSLRPGRWADVVIWNGDPLELKSAPLAIYVDGRLQPAGSRQTELTTRYTMPAAALPPAYDRQ